MNMFVTMFSSTNLSYVKRFSPGSSIFRQLYDLMTFERTAYSFLKGWQRISDCGSEWLVVVVLKECKFTDTLCILLPTTFSQVRSRGLF